MSNKQTPILIGVAVLLVLIGVGSWFFIRNTADPITNELIEASKRAQGGPNFENPEGLITQLTQIDIEPENIPQVTFLISRLLTIDRPAGPRAPHALPAGPAWIAKKRTMPPLTQLRMTQIEAATSWSGTARYILELYEKDFGQTRASIHYLVNYKNYLPVITMIFSQALYEKFGLESTFHFAKELTEETKAALRRLLEGDTFIEWAKSKTVNLRNYAGNTDTMLGAFDWIASPEYAEQVGFNKLPKNADAYYDLGGGFGTPDISRLIGHKFTSYDVLAPRQAKNLNPIIRTLTSWLKPMLYTNEARPLSKEERESYYSALEKTPYMKFNIFENSFPTDKNSYLITSFGFLASTAATHTTNIPVMQSPMFPKIFMTTYMGVRRIVELVALGKEVTLFSCTRGSPRLFQFQTALLMFRNHHLVDEKLRPLDMEKQSGELKRIAMKAR